MLLGAWIVSNIQSMHSPDFPHQSSPFTECAVMRTHGLVISNISDRIVDLQRRAIVVCTLVVRLLAVPADSVELQRSKLELLAEQNTAFAHKTSNADKIEAAIANYETAFRMQSALPRCVELDNEPAHILAMYGVGSSDEHQNYYAMQTLRARRLVEAGVRFIEITCPSFDGNNSPWDQHGELKANHQKNARITDQSVAALILDLKQRGLLDQTLVVWAGERGRTPHSPGKDGRDHHINGYSIFLAGGGIRGGMTYGTTNEFGEAVADKPVTIHDIHATILHQLGIDHERLTFRHGGRDHRLTDVHGNVLKEILV